MDSQEPFRPRLITAPQLGKVPDDGLATLGDVRIARGRRIFANQERHPGLPAQGWDIEELDPRESADGLWHRLASQFNRTGLWPVVGVDDDYLVPAWERHRLWRDESAPRPTDIRGLFGLDRRGAYDMREDGYCFECGTVKDRSGELTIPGDAPDIECLESWDWWGRDRSRVSLVPALRPADAVAQLGWSGAANGGWYGGALILNEEACPCPIHHSSPAWAGAFDSALLAGVSIRSSETPTSWRCGWTASPTSSPVP